MTSIAATAELESSLEGHFRLAVRQAGGKAVKMTPVEAGIPDRLVILPNGRIYLVELKTDTGDLSPIQKVVHARLKLIGTTVVVLAGRDEIDAWLAATL